MTLLGFAAGILTTGSIIPQVIKTYRTRSARDLSLAWLVLITVGVALWIVYGLLVVSYPVIAANGAGVLLDLALLYMKLRYG